MAYPDTTLGTDASGFDYPDQTYRRKLVFTVADKKLRKEFVDNLIFKNWIGKGGEFAPILFRQELGKNSGDTIRMSLLPKMTGNGVAGDGTLVGNEEVVDFYTFDVYVNQLRHAITTHGKMSDQRGLFKILDYARPGLSTWLAQLVEDYFIRTCYYNWPPHILGTAATYYGYGINSSAPRAARYWFCADESNNSITYSTTDQNYCSAIATAEGTLSDVASDRFSPDILEGIGVKMRVLDIPRVSLKGFNGFLNVLHPYQVAQLRTHSTWFNAQIHAGPRDDKGNSVFAGVNGSGEVGVWNNFYIMESNKIGASNQSALKAEVMTYINAAASANVRRAICMGAGAMAYAEAQGPQHGTEIKDYGNKKGVSIGTIFGIGRTDYRKDVTPGTTQISQNLVIVSTYSPATTI